MLDGAHAQFVILSSDLSGIIIFIIRDMKNKNEKKQSNDLAPIASFEGYYTFLSNDFPTWVCYQGIMYPSVTTAFQAARTDDLVIRQKISKITDAEQFRSVVLNIKNPEDWSERKEAVMTILIRDKFKRNKQLQNKLLSTKDKKLLNNLKREGYNELYWGIFEGKGQNTLGKVLMNIREQFMKETDALKWVQNNLNIERDPKMLASVSLVVEKEGKKIDKLFLDKNKSYYLFGKAKANDFHLQNPTISRYHACIYFNNDLEVMLVDLNSTQGTFLKRAGEKVFQKLEQLIGYKLSSDDCIKLGSSVREYIVEIDRSSVEKYIEQSERNLKLQLEQVSHRADQLQNHENLNRQELRHALGFERKYLLVEGISESTGYQKLKQIYEKYGRVSKVRMRFDRITGKFEGLAVIYFEKQKGLQEALRNRKENPYTITAISEELAQKKLRSQSELGGRRRQKSRSRSREKRLK